MKFRNAIVAVLVLGGIARGEDVLKTLRPGHPRLMVLQEDVDRVKGLVQSDPTAKEYFEHIRQVGDKLLNEPVSERVKIGPRLLGISRQVLGRVSTLGGLYRLTREKKYADRCRDEMLAAARFTDWNPSHFLDVAEMTNALGIGYDWIYDTLTPDQRKEISGAIVEKGLKEGLKIYAAGNWWTKNSNNWNQVCNGGLIVGALAVAEEYPEVSRKVIESARASLPISMAEYAPDGGWVEGPTYWWYATRYTVFYLSALHTALGTGLGFMSTPGFEATGNFRMQTIGPTEKTFNFSDAGSAPGGAPQMFWMARMMHRPVYAAQERSVIRRIGMNYVDPFHLMWFDPEGTAADIEQLPTSVLFRGINVALLRTGWGSSAGFVGIKGGSSSHSHAHLDLGSFVYDAEGMRWAMDLGPDDYNLPGYFGGQRWNYYRLRTEGHNTLTINGANEDLKGNTKVVAISGEGSPRFAVIDLSAAYPNLVHRWMRGVELDDHEGLLVQDELEGGEPVEVVWNLHTPAKIEIADDGKSAVLSQGGKKLNVRLLSPEGARFETAEADIPPDVKSTVPSGSKKREEEKKLVVRLNEKVKETRIVVKLTPGGQKGEDMKVMPLEDWAKGAAIRQ